MNQTELILGYQLAEYKESSIWKNRLLFVQLLVAIPSAISIFTENEPIMTYFLAVSGILMSLVWLWVDHLYRKHRGAAERARRTTLALDGLGASISRAEIRGIIDGFTVRRERAKSAFRPQYFASTAPPGPRRVAEIVEESAYYTADIHSASALFMVIAFGICMGLLVLTVSAALPFADHTILMDLARMFFVFLLFALSSDVLGVIRGHLSTAKVASAVYQRLSAAAARGYPVADILLIVGDYNAAAESSPLPIPLVFKWRATAIRRRWADYQAGYSATQTQP
jgi:hypothetical protein